jgi:undecaprenyl diphosphate synthase
MTQSTKIPKHVAIIMDGNGRWAQNRRLPRIAGHRAGIEALRRIVKACAEKNIAILTLFAFSSENWQRPIYEVNELMKLFLLGFKKELIKLHENNVQVRIIGDSSRFEPALRQWIKKAQDLTSNNTGLKLNIAMNYGGRWDIAHAMQKIGMALLIENLSITDITPDLIAENLSLGDLPDPDLFIRTSGEKRISNFLLWQLAYSELYFTDVLWPDFTINDLDMALHCYANRQRRFGFTGEQVEKSLVGTGG